MEWPELSNTVDSFATVTGVVGSVGAFALLSDVLDDDS